MAQVKMETLIKNINSLVNASDESNLFPYYKGRFNIKSTRAEIYYTLSSEEYKIVLQELVRFISEGITISEIKREETRLFVEKIVKDLYPDKKADEIKNLRYGDMPEFSQKVNNKVNSVSKINAIYHNLTVKGNTPKNKTFYVVNSGVNAEGKESVFVEKIRKNLVKPEVVKKPGKGRGGITGGNKGGNVTISEIYKLVQNINVNVNKVIQTIDIREQRTINLINNIINQVANITEQVTSINNVVNKTERNSKIINNTNIFNIYNQTNNVYNDLSQVNEILIDMINNHNNKLSVDIGKKVEKLDKILGKYNKYEIWNKPFKRVTEVKKPEGGWVSLLGGGKFTEEPKKDKVVAKKDPKTPEVVKPETKKPEVKKPEVEEPKKGLCDINSTTVDGKVSSAFFGLKRNMAGGDVEVTIVYDLSGNKKFKLTERVETSKATKYTAELSETENLVVKLCKNAIAQLKENSEKEDALYDYKDYVSKSQIEKLEFILNELESNNVAAIEQINDLRFKDSAIGRFINEIFFNSKTQWDKFAIGATIDSEYQSESVCSKLIEKLGGETKDYTDIQTTLRDALLKEFFNRKTKLVDGMKRHKEGDAGIVAEHPEPKKGEDKKPVETKPAAGTSGTGVVAGKSSDGKENVGDSKREDVLRPEGKSEPKKGEDKKPVEKPEEGKEGLTRHGESGATATENSSEDEKAKKSGFFNRFSKSNKSKKRGTWIGRHPVVRAFIISGVVFTAAALAISAIMATAGGAGLIGGFAPFFTALSYNFGFAMPFVGIGVAAVTGGSAAFGYAKRKYNKAYNKTIMREREAKKEMKKADKVLDMKWFKNRTYNPNLNSKDLNNLFENLLKSKKYLTKDIDKLQSRISNRSDIIDNKRARKGKSPKDLKTYNGSLYDTYYDYLTKREQFKEYIKEVYNSGKLNSSERRRFKGMYESIQNIDSCEEFVYERTMDPRFSGGYPKIIDLGKGESFESFIRKGSSAERIESNRVTVETKPVVVETRPVEVARPVETIDDKDKRILPEDRAPRGKGR